MFEFLAAYLKEKTDMTDEELQRVKEVAIARKLRKRQYLLQEGDISHYNCFVGKGCLRLYRVGKDGAEHNLKFAIENWWISDYESYNSGLSSKSNIDALDDSELIMIKKQDFDALISEIPRFQKLVEQLENKSFDVSQNRIISNISDTAEEKYENFMKSYPEFHARIPLHMVASFLGVSRETLSRVRSKFAR
ncbi:MAG: Crp/Fnr family transcriptional regulator [Dyadobacter sp.]